MLRNPKLAISLLPSTRTRWNFVFGYWNASYAGMKFSGQGSITSFQLCFASLGGPLKTCMPFYAVSSGVLKLAVPWNETYPDTTKLGKHPSGACERVSCSSCSSCPVWLSRNPFVMAKRLPALWWEDCRTWPPTLPLCKSFLSGTTKWAAQP